MKKILTISIAAYNVSQYLEKLINSIINSNEMSQIQLLIVNDGSTDNTLKMAQMYSQKYPDSIQVVDKTNGGHGSTINEGLKHATGKYFKAIDGDDWVDSIGLKKLVNSLKNNETDVVINDYYECYSNCKKIIKCMPYESGIYCLEDIINKIDYLPYHSVVYNTKFLLEHYHKLDEHCFYVDIEYALMAFIFADKLSYFDYPLYCYRLGDNGQSVSWESRSIHSEDSRRVCRALFEFYREKRSFLSDNRQSYFINAVNGEFLWYIDSIIYNDLQSEIKVQNFIDEMTSIIPEYRKICGSKKIKILINFIKIPFVYNMYHRYLYKQKN